MNEYDQSDVAYESAPKEVPIKKKRSNPEFPGNVMEQGNKTAKGADYVEKEYPANPGSLQRHGEYR